MGGWERAARDTFFFLVIIIHLRHHKPTTCHVHAQKAAHEVTEHDITRTCCCWYTPPPKLP
jgi:hypothetical protein